MRKLILMILGFLLGVCLMSSCDIEICPRCDKPISYCVCNNSVYKSNYSNGDYFCANSLIGTWQIEYNEGYYYGLGIMLKQIQFFDGHTCDITYCGWRDPDWFTDTYTYTYTSGYIKFNKGKTTFMFKYVDFLFPTLTIQDSFGTYIWKKNR